MGTTQSTNSSAPPGPISAENENMLASTTNASESDDEFAECTEEFDILNADISADDIVERNSKPLEKENSDDDDARAQAKHKQIESDDDDDESFEDRKERQRKEMEDFREEMNKKREMRQQCIKKLREELKDLREKLSSEMDTNAQLRDALECQGESKSFNELADENKKLKAELAECQMFLQTSNSENITSTFEKQALRDQVRSLKEVISAVKEMLKIREVQVDQMKSKLAEIESTFAERETKIMSTALQQEYQRQLENIRNMRELYDERAGILNREKDAIKQKLEEKEDDLKTEIEKSSKLEEHISTLESNLKSKTDDIAHLESEMSMLRSDKAQVASEMTAINQLVAQVLFGFNANGNHIDIDKLVSMLEQNRDLLNEMAIKEDYEGIDEGSFLPKLLYDLFLQVNLPTAEGSQEPKTPENCCVNSPEEIAEKLPKVWRVLIELLSHHKKLSEEEEERVIDCYKSVQTPSGTQNVISVSKTFIKLKDLILEKRSLQKDTTRLKTLYGHLEQRLDKQEKKLSTVSLELTKTWHLVGKIKRQNRQLHTHEQILCYQLQQKRRLLNELKAELEYCRKKWALARALNNESEEQCKQLRHEFSMRKVQDQNSAESGYSDEHPSEGEDDEAGTSKVAKENRFDENLLKFDRTASPAGSERRRSESPSVTDFSKFSFFSRAQSEPPRDSTSPIVDPDMTEILDLIPDPLLERCIVTQEETDNPNRLVVTPSPEVLVHSQPKLKAQMRKHKKDKKLKTSSSKGESAEEMFMRLTGKSINECSMCSSSSIDEDDQENVEEIQEIPMDEADNVQELSEVVLKEEEAHVAEIEQTVNDEPQPSTSVEKNDVTALTTKEQDFLQRREERLSRLEAEAQAFYDKMARNKDKGVKLDNHLNDIHQTFLVRNRDKSKSEGEKSEDGPSTSGEQTNKSPKPDPKDSDEEHDEE